MRYIFAVLNWDGDHLTVRLGHTDAPQTRFMSGHTLFSETVEADDPKLIDDLLIELYKVIESDIRKSYLKVGTKECKLDSLMRDVGGRKIVTRNQHA